MTTPPYTDIVRALPASVPFVGPEVRERETGQPFAARLGANENVFGPSPKAIEAMQAEIHDIWKYSDATSHDLRHALAAHYDVQPENILVGEGIDGLLGYLVRLLIGPGDAVVTSDGAYPTFNYHVAGYGGMLYKVPYTDDHEDPTALFAKAKEVGAKLVYLANPDNPMGTWHAGETLLAALDNLPEGCLLMLDEAYIEFAPAGAAPVLPIDDPRVIRMRTFSKAYGIAGARIGYAMGAPGLIQSFDKIRNHFGVNRVAQSGALAALQDQDWLKQTCDHTAEARERIAGIASGNGLLSLPSASNFVAVDCGCNGAFARTVLNGLIERGIFVRMPAVAPLDRCIRISCGRPQDLDLLAKALPEALEAARA